MFRFSIRELILVTLVVALGLGWGADRKTAASKVQIMKKEFSTTSVFLRESGGFVEETDEYLIVGGRVGNGIFLRRGQTSLSQEAIALIVEERIKKHQKELATPDEAICGGGSNWK
jgi:hypothetical protein